MHKVLLALSLLGPALAARAQITGDTIVCSGRIYTYTADVPGAASYAWSFPSGWYDASGMGTAQLTITCNVSIGDVCVTASDDLGSVLATHCMTTDFGGGGAGFDVQPASVEGCATADVELTLVPNGTGGGCADCGGTPHPNIDYAVYLNSMFFAGFLGSPLTIFPPGGTLTVVLVDHTNGTSPTDAIVISGGCGGSGSNSSQVTVHQQLYPVFVQQPEAVCLGETVTVSVANASWGDFHDLVDLDPANTSGSLSATVTGPNASYQYTGLDANLCPMEEAGHSVAYCISTDLGTPPTADDGLSLITGPDHTFLVDPSAADALEHISILTLSGSLLNEIPTDPVDLSNYPPGLYVLEAHTISGTVTRWKVLR